MRVIYPTSFEPDGERVVVDDGRVLVGWRIYYADGSEFSSKDGDWAAAPSVGVQAVVLYEARTYPIWIDGRWVTENYKVVLHQCDYYWRTPDGAFACGPSTFAPLAPALVKTGLWVESDKFKEIINRAQRESAW